MQRQQEERYAQEVVKIFEDSKGTYGAERICGAIRRRGESASYRKVRQIMRARNLRSIHVRRRQRSLTDSRNSRSDGYENLVRDQAITKPFQVLTSDISYVRTAEGFSYLCKIRDVTSGVVLAHTIREHMRAELVIDTIRKAQKRWEIPKGCIFHSDRGSQFTAEDTVRILRKNGLRPSYSRVGKPGDNAWSESFFANLKKEAVHWRHFATREEA